MSTASFAQNNYYGTFDPQVTKAFNVPIGTTISFTTTLNWQYGGNPRFAPWAKVKVESYDSSITIDGWNGGGGSAGGSSTLKISVHSRYPRCYYPGGITATYTIPPDSTVHPLAFFAVIGGFYDTIVKHAKVIPDTLSLKSRVGDSASSGFSVSTGYSDLYRTFTAQNVIAPFSLVDSIPLSYCYTPLSFIRFHPMKPGHYIDTALILDPLTNDTLPLILIGDAFDAGVNEEAAQPLKLYPNPCDRTLTLELPDGGPALVEIRNLLGETVYGSRVTCEVSIDCSRLPDGVYFARIRSGERVINRRVVVAH